VFGKWVNVWRLPPLSYIIRRKYIQTTCWICGTRLITKDKDLAEKFLNQHEKNCVEKLEWFMIDEFNL